MNSNIITEVSRMKELMGINPSLLIETQLITRMAKQLTDDGIKAFNRNADDIVKVLKTNKDVVNSISNPNINKVVKIGLDDVTVGELKELANFIKQGQKNFLQQSDNLKRVLGIVLSNDNSDGTKKIINNLYDNFVRNAQTINPIDPMSEKTLLNILKSESDKQGVDYERLIFTLLDDGSLSTGDLEVLSKLLGKKVGERVAELTSNPSAFKSITSTIISPKAGDEVVLNLVDDFYRGNTEVQNIIKQIPPINAIAKGIRNVEERYLGGFGTVFARKWYAYLFTTEQDMLRRARNYVVDALDKLEKQPNIDVTRELNAAAQMILLSKKRAKLGIEEVFNALMKDNPNLKSYGSYDKFVNTLKGKGIDIEKMVKAASYSSDAAISGAFNDLLRSYAELIPGIRLMDTSKNRSIIQNFMYRWFNFVTWKDPRGLSEFVEQASKRGVRAEVLSKISFFLVSTALTSVIGALSDTWKSNIASNKYKSYILIFEELCSLAKSKNDEQADAICDFAEVLKEKYGEFQEFEDFKKNLIKNFPFFVSESENIKFDPLFWTYWDGLVDKLVNNPIFPLLGESEINKEIEEFKQTLPPNVADFFDPSKSFDENLEIIRRRLNSGDSSQRDSTSTPTPTDSTTTTRPGGSTPTTTPPPLEPLSPEDIQGWLRIATFTKINENTYKMKFTTDQNALENFGLPSTFAGKTADVNNVNGTWKYTIDGQENIF